MPTVNFTARNVGKLEPPQNGRIEYFDANLAGFGQRVSAIRPPATEPNRTWFVLYRYRGVQKRYTIGPFDKWTLADARDKADDVLRDAAKGRNPQGEKIEERKAETIKQLTARYIDEWAKPRKRTWKADQNIINKNLIPAIGSKKPSDVTRADIRGILAAVKERGSPVQSNRTFEVVRKF
ncbi:MAG TPA: integrase arm-type DNA-binding domain-containing protein, partial [Stellaceae bacterium]|nr:integrase arm-type DNA-binding domain-containing protein [Stellaceae bacterium]